MGLLHFAQYTNDLYYTTSTSTSSSDVSLAALLPVIFFTLALSVFMVIVLWKVYQKAGKPGWAAIVPVYNSWVLFEIVGYPGWWAILSLVPFVNIFPAVMMLVAYFKLAKLFGKSDGFAVCNILFSYVTMPILAFGKAQFQGPAVAVAQTPAMPVAPVMPEQVVPMAPAASVAPDAQTVPTLQTTPVAQAAPATPQAEVPQPEAPQIIAPADASETNNTPPTPPQPPVVQ